MNTTMNRRRQQLSGLTMLELLSTIAIMAVLVALLAAGLRSAKQRAADAGCLHNLRTLGVGMHAFAAENNGRLPEIRRETRPDGSTNSMPGHQWDVQIAQYLDIDLRTETQRPTPFVCPGAIRYPNHDLGWGRNLSYGLNVRVGNDVLGSGRLATIEHPSQLVVIADRERTAGTNENWLTLHGASSAMFIGDTAARYGALPYERHGGRIHILFADGHVAAREKLGTPSSPFPANAPRGVRWYNTGPLSPSH